MIKGDDWDVGTVLDHGLPLLPSVLKPDDEWPVAVWRRGNVGAVLSVIFDPEDDHGEPFAQDIEVRLRTKDGVWEWAATVGSDWQFDFPERPEGGRPELSGFSTTIRSPDDEGVFVIASGLAPADVRRVRVALGDEEPVEVEPTTGAFLLRLPGPDASRNYMVVIDAT